MRVGRSDAEVQMWLSESTTLRHDSYLVNVGSSFSLCGGDCALGENYSMRYS